MGPLHRSRLDASTAMALPAFVLLQGSRLREAMLVLGRTVPCRVASEAEFADILLANVASWVMVAYDLPVSIQFKIDVWTR